MLQISKLSVVNNALNELGRLAVTNITDSEDSILLGEKVDLLLPVLLQATIWNFAVKYHQDSTPTTSQFSTDYNYTYELPSDYGQMYAWGNFNNNFSDPGSQPYLITDGQISCNSNPINFYYIVSNVPISAVSTLFYRALSLYVASDACLVLTTNMELTRDLRNKFEMAKSDAIIRNDMERFIITRPYNDYNRINYV